VYATNAGGRDHTGLYVMNSDGSGTQRLASSRTTDYTDPSWSPDGATIAFGIAKPAETPRGLDLSIAGSRRRRRRQLRRLTRPGGADEVIRTGRRTEPQSRSSGTDSSP
jgi:Tol biopolymer transport system component